MLFREHRKRPQGLADLLSWGALVAPGVVVNKDGSFLAGWRYRGPDVDSATPEELGILARHRPGGSAGRATGGAVSSAGPVSKDRSRES